MNRLNSNLGKRVARTWAGDRLCGRVGPRAGPPDSPRLDLVLNIAVAERAGLLVLGYPSER